MRYRDQDATASGGIRLEWVERVVTQPTLTLPDAMDASLEHRLSVIEEHGSRALRVVVNREVEPERVVTAYFDRSMKGRL